MRQDTAKSKCSDREALWLIGFRINPEREDPEIYTLIAHRDKDRPLVVDNQIVFFTRPELAIKALELADPNIKKLGPPPKDVDLVCDLAETLYLIDSKDIDPSATIINFLNTLFDLVAAIDTPIPSEYKQVLYSFADHLTFNRGYGKFLTQQKISRSMIINAIYWCVGAVFCNTHTLTKNSRGHL